MKHIIEWLWSDPPCAAIPILFSSSSRISICQVRTQKKVFRKDRRQARIQAVHLCLWRWCRICLDPGIGQMARGRHLRLPRAAVTPCVSCLKLCLVTDHFAAPDTARAIYGVGKKLERIFLHSSHQHKYVVTQAVYPRFTNEEWTYPIRSVAGSTSNEPILGSTRVESCKLVRQSCCDIGRFDCLKSYKNCPHDTISWKWSEIIIVTCFRGSMILYWIIKIILECLKQYQHLSVHWKHSKFFWGIQHLKNNS